MQGIPWKFSSNQYAQLNTTWINKKSTFYSDKLVQNLYKWQRKAFSWNQDRWQAPKLLILCQQGIKTDWGPTKNPSLLSEHTIFQKSLCKKEKNPTGLMVVWAKKRLQNRKRFEFQIVVFLQVINCLSSIYANSNYSTAR